MKGRMEEEAASPNFPWQAPLSNAADSGGLIIQRLSIRFNPLKDLNVHLL